MHSPARRIGSMEIAPVARLAARANELRRRGRDVTVLSSGELEFPTPDHVIEAAARAARSVPVGYGPVDGSIVLKEALQRKFSRDSGLHVEPDQLLVSGGSKQAMFNAFMATVDDGDEVVVPAPYWSSYLELARLAGAVPVVAKTSKSSNWKLTPELLGEVLTPATKWVVLNNPVNPTGQLYSAAELRSLAEILERHPHVWVLSDDLYENYIYDGQRHATLAQWAPQLQERTVTITGVSKTYAMMGWRIGFAAGPKAIIADMAKVQSQSTSGASVVSQAAAVAALDGPQDVVARMRDVLQNTRDSLMDAVETLPGIRVPSIRGAFYAYLSCSELIATLRSNGRIMDERMLAEEILEQAGVVVLPGTECGLAPFLRLNFACQPDRLARGIAGIRATIQDLLS